MKNVLRLNVMIVYSAWLSECLQDGFNQVAQGDASRGEPDVLWVSFLDGMQRVLLFTEDLATVLVAQQVCDGFGIDERRPLQ
jgi:hypothetical protein